jgi:hypothetical protein
MNVDESDAELLARWCALVGAELGFPELDVDRERLLALAGVVAHSVHRPSAPLTTYIVGIVAGFAMGRGTADPAVAQHEAIEAILRLSRAPDLGDRLRESP